MDADTELERFCCLRFHRFFLHLTYFRLSPHGELSPSPTSCFGGHAATPGAHCELVARLEFGPSVLDEIVLQESVIAWWKGWQ